MERAQSSPKAGTQQSGISSDEVVNPQHYKRLALKQTVSASDTLVDDVAGSGLDLLDHHRPGDAADADLALVIGGIETVERTLFGKEIE